MDSICISKSFYTFVIFIHETRDDGLKRGSFDKATLCANNKKPAFFFCMCYYYGFCLKWK